MDNIRLALVVPCFNEDKVLDETIKRLSAVLNELIESKNISSDSFIKFIDDGSKDNTWEIIKNHSVTNPLVKGLRLSKNEGHQKALLAGMRAVEGKCDCLISIDADLQQDETLIGEFIEKYKNGADVVLGIRKDRGTDSLLKKSTALFFYALMQKMGVNIVKNHADYRLLSSRANSALLEFKEVNLFLRGLVSLIGYNRDYVYFDVKDRFAGESKYTISKMLTLALDGITSFSVTPLRFISIIGFIVFFSSFIMGGYVVYIYLFTDRAVPGWSSTVLPIYAIGGIQILSIGVLGEYMGKIYKETKRRPHYFIEEDIF